jgi:hypothetical protein
MMTYNDAIEQLKQSVMTKYKLKGRFELFSIAVTNLFSLGYVVTKQFILSLCLGHDTYTKLLKDKEQTTRTLRTTKDDRVFFLASQHIEEIQQQIKNLDIDTTNKLREYKRINDNVNKLLYGYNNKQLFGIKKPIQLRQYKLSNYARHYDNSFITKYLHNADTFIELQQKIKQIPQYFEAYKQLWNDYYNNKKNRFCYAIPCKINNKLKCDCMSKEDIQASLKSLGIMTA